MCAPGSGEGAPTVPRRLRQVRDETELADGPEPRVLDLDDLGVGDEVGVREGAEGVPEWLGGHVLRGSEVAHPLLAGALQHAQQHALAQLLAIRLGEPARSAVEALLRVDVLEADRRDEGVEEVIDEVCRLDPLPVAGHHGLVVDRRLRSVGAELVARHLRREAALQLRADQAVHVVGHQALQQAGLDQLTAPTAVAHQQRPEDAGQRGLRRRMRPRLDRGEGRPLARGHPTEVLHPPGLRGHDALVAGVAGVGTARPEAGDRAVDEAGVALTQRRVVRAEALGAAGPERDDHHIRARRQLAQAFARALLAGVEGDRALAAQPDRRGGEAAERVAAGPLDLDHVGAVVGEHHRRDAADRAAAEVDHADVVAGAAQRPVAGPVCHDAATLSSAATRARSSAS